MKRTTVLLLTVLALLALAACSQSTVTTAPAAEPTEAPAAAPAAEPTAEPTPAPTPEPTPEPTPVTIPATVLLDRVGAVAKTFNKGDVVEIQDEQDEYYLLSDGLLVEKWLVRPNSEAAPAERKTYAKSNAAVYDNPYCEGKPIATLSYGQTVTVLDEFGKVLYITSDIKNSGTITGYMLTDESTNYIGNGGGGGGGNAGGGGGGGGPQDGGEISLTRANVPTGGIILLSTKVSGPATVLADGTEAYYGIFGRGYEVRVLERGEKVCTILLEDGNTATVPTMLLVFEDDEPYEPWTGYSKANALFYHDWRVRLSDSEKLTMNTKLNVIGVFGEDDEYYIVELEDGRVGLVSTALVSETEQYYRSSGGSSESAPTVSTPQWSDPVL